MKKSRYTDQIAYALRQAETGTPVAEVIRRMGIVDLIQWLFDEYGVSVSKQTLSRDLRAMGYGKLTARPRHHAQGADAIDVFRAVFDRYESLGDSHGA